MATMEPNLEPGTTKTSLSNWEIALILFFALTLLLIFGGFKFEVQLLQD